MLPPALFVVGFVAMWFGLEWAGLVLFSHRWPLWLLAVTPWVWWMHVAGYAGLSRTRGALALVSRFVLLGLLIALLGEPRAVRSDDRLSVMYIVDASASVAGEAQTGALDYIRRVVDAKPEADEAGLMYFGRNAAVELPPGPTLPLSDTADGAAPTMAVRIDREGTDLASALSTAAAVLPSDRPGRIVLISDGVSTAGPLDAALDDLAARGIAVDVLPIDYRTEHEVWLERLELPRDVKVGQPYEAAVLLNALSPGKGRLTLRENGQVLHEADVEYDAGKARFAVPIRLRRAGYYEYTATIEPRPGADRWANNNLAISYIYLRDKGRVLVVTDPQADPRATAPLLEALRTNEREVSVAGPFDVPSDPLALLPYDAVVLLNVPRDLFTELQLRALHDAVKQQGTGLMMVGGSQSFGPGAWGGTPVEEALPVSMDVTQRKVLLNGAMVFVLDHSGSMAEPVMGAPLTKQQVANNAAAAAIGTLGARDYFGVVAFDVFPTWVVSFGQNRNRQAAAAKVRTIQPAGGTDMYPAIDEALAQLVNLGEGKAAVKHVVLMTDGYSAPGDTPAVVQRFRAAKVSITTVGVGSSVDSTVLRELAEQTGGKFHAVQRPEELPRIFIREAAVLRRTALRDRRFTPQAAAPSPVLKGIDALPPLDGLVLTTAKNRASVVLRAPAENKGDEPDPVLATWRYGVGAAAAFTSDLSTHWAAGWVNWDRYEPFVQQLITDISRSTSDSDLRLRTFPADGQGVIVVEDYAPKPMLLQMKAQVGGPRDTTLTLDLEQTGPRRYEARFPLDGEGRYQVMAVGIGGVGSGDDDDDAARDQRVMGGFVVPYSAEYLRFRSNPIALRTVAERTGGRELRGNETAEAFYGLERTPRRTSRPITDWLLVALACLIPLDVGLRRVQLDTSVIARFFRRRERQPDQTMSALLERKRRTDDRLRPAAPAQPTSLDAPTPKKPAAAPQARPTPADKPDALAPDRPMTMTERLMAAKQRAQSQMKKDDEA